MTRPIYRDGHLAFLCPEKYAAHMAEKYARPFPKKVERVSLGIIEDAGCVPERHDDRETVEDAYGVRGWGAAVADEPEAIASEDRAVPAREKVERETRSIHTNDRSEALRIARQRRGAVKNAAGGGYTVTFRDWA